MRSILLTIFFSLPFLTPRVKAEDNPAGLLVQRVFATPPGSTIKELSKYKGRELLVLFSGNLACLSQAGDFFKKDSIHQLDRFLHSAACDKLEYRVVFRNAGGQIDSVYQFGKNFQLTDRLVNRGNEILDISRVDEKGNFYDRFDFRYGEKYREAGESVPSMDKLVREYYVYQFTDRNFYSQGDAWVISVGIDNYGSTQFRNCKSDASTYVEYFEKAFFSKFPGVGKDKFHSYILLDSMATRKNILEVLQDISRRASFNDYFIFNFSGQSSMHTVDSATWATYFHPFDIAGSAEKPIKRNPNLPGDLTEFMLSLQVLQEFIQQIPAENQLFISEAGPSDKFKPEFIRALMRNSIEVASLLNKNRVVIVPNRYGMDNFRCGDSMIQKGPLNHIITSLQYDHPQSFRRNNVFDLFDSGNKAERLVYAMKQVEFTCSFTSVPYFEVFFERKFLEDYRQLLSNDNTTRGLKGRSNVLQKEISELTGQRYALLIGTDKYESKDWKGLANPVKDVKAVGEVLRDLYGFEVQILENQPLDTIFSTIGDYYRRVQPNDQVIIYFAGHGDVDDQLLSDGFVVCTDSKSPEKDIGRNSYISYLKLQKMINNLSARQVLVMLDVCHGGVFDQKAFDSRDNSTTAHIANRNVLELLKDKLPLRTRKFLSSVGAQSAFDGEAGRHSPFVNQLLQILTSQAKDPNGIVLLSDIYSVLVKSSLNETATLKISPHMADFGNVDAFTEFVFIPLVK